MIILKDITQTLQLNTTTGIVAPTRKGAVHATGSGAGVTLTPDGTITVGDWMIIVLATFTGTTATTPTGWTIVQPFTASGTQYTIIYGKLREVGDTSYEVTLGSNVVTSDGSLFWGSGSDVVSSWIVGTTMSRTSIMPTTTTDTIAPSITTTTDHTLVLSIATERTITDESDIVSITGAQKWVYFPQSGTADLQTTTVGVLRDVSPAGTSSDVRFSYPNEQGSNGQGVQIGIPPAKTVTLDSSATFIDINAAGTTTMSTYDTKATIGVGSTLFADEVPVNQNAPGDTAAVELGLDFTAYVSGIVTAVRYYKGVGSSTASKDGHLWTSTGTLLASVTFVNETASGWQTQVLSAPVSLTAGSDYVVSYYAPAGNYAYTTGYFSTANKYAGPLAVNRLGGASSLGNGVYKYSATSGVFPDRTSGFTNYFVDVVFQIDPQQAMVTALTSPATTNQRELKQLTVVNNGTASNAVSLTKTQTSASYRLTPIVILAPGEMLQYDDRVGWKLFNTDATIKANFAVPAVGSTQIAFNSNGVVASSADLLWLRTQDTLKVSGANNPTIRLGAVSATPSVPVASKLEVYGQRISGKIQLVKQGPSADNEAVQSSLWQNNTVTWTPSSNAGTWIGATGVNIGVAVQVTPSSTNAYTQMRRSTFATAAGVNTQAGLRSEGLYYVSADPGIGGFLYVCRFGFDSVKSGGRAFAGMVPTASTNIATVEPSSLLNMCGFAFDSTDNAWSFMHNDATGTAIKESISGQGVLATNNTGYDAYIWNPGTSKVIYYRLDRTDTGATIAEGSVSGNVPASNTQLMAVIHCGNGTNTLAGDMTMGVNRLYIESNR